jgi:uncharacterized protein
MLRPARMSARLATAVLIAVLWAAAPAQAVSTDLVISQLYGGGGNSGATFTHDFVEIFNRSSEPVSVDGWSVQYASWPAPRGRSRR